MEIKLRQFDGRQALRNTRHPRQQRTDCGLDLEDDAGSTGGQHRYVASVLKRVAKPFVAVKQNGLAFDGHVSTPGGLGEASGPAARGARPSRVAADPAFFEVSLQQVEHRRIPAQGCIVGSSAATRS